MTGKPKVAICWLGACGGCDEAVVDLNEELLEIAGMVDIVLWPVAMDFKYEHLGKMAAGEISLSIITGCVRNEEQEDVAKQLRGKSSLVLSFGACACFGGVPGLANFFTREDILRYVYQDAPTVVNPEGRFPRTETIVNGNSLTLPELYDHVYALNQVIDVDYYLPGCPPPPDLILNAFRSVLSGDLPPKGSALAPRKALCDTCPRNRSKPLRMEIREIKRIHEVEADPDSCFLAEGIICLGPATRTGCGEACIRTNTPCRGCFGPVPGVADGGAKYLSALSSLVKAGRERDATVVKDAIDDPAGYFFRFTQPTSILGKRMRKSKEG